MYAKRERKRERESRRQATQNQFSLSDILTDINISVAKVTVALEAYNNSSSSSSIKISSSNIIIEWLRYEAEAQKKV